MRVLQCHIYPLQPPGVFNKCQPLLTALFIISLIKSHKLMFKTVESGLFVTTQSPLLLIAVYCDCGANTRQGHENEWSILLIAWSVLWIQTFLYDCPWQQLALFPSKSPGQMMSLLYNTDTHPTLWNCHVWRHSPILICADIPILRIGNWDHLGESLAAPPGSLAQA